MVTTNIKIKKIEIKNGQAKSFTLGEEKIIISNIEEQYFAISDICSHDDGEMVSGECSLVEGCQVECPRHGARFDVRTGKATRMPAVAPIKTFNVIVKGDELEVEVEG